MVASLTRGKVCVVGSGYGGEGFILWRCGDIGLEKCNAVIISGQWGSLFCFLYSHWIFTLLVYYFYFILASLGLCCCSREERLNKNLLGEYFKEPGEATH